jgi:hypothetical protein
MPRVLGDVGSELANERLELCGRALGPRRAALCLVEQEQQRFPIRVVERGKELPQETDLLSL